MKRKNQLFLLEHELTQIYLYNKSEFFKTHYDFSNKIINYFIGKIQAILLLIIHIINSK